MAVVLASFLLLVIDFVGTNAGMNVKHINDYADRETIFRARLLQDYDSHVIPRRSDTMPLNCTINFHPMRVLKTNFDDGEIEIILWMDLTWNDYRLKWDVNSSFGIQKFAIPRGEIWQPDFVSLNGLAEPATQGGSDSQAYVFPTGDVAIVPAMKVRAYCNDRGTKESNKGEVHWMLCDLRFGSAMHDVRIFNIVLGNVVYETLYPLTMTKTTVKISKPRLDLKYMDCCPDPFQDIILPVYLSHVHDDKN